MVRRRGHTITELVAATSLLVVLIAAHVPGPAPAQGLTEAVEAEAARLLVEGELTLVRQEVARGALKPGVWRRDARRWPSAARLRELELVATVGAPGSQGLGDGLVELVVDARWRSGADLERGARSVRQSTLAPAGRSP